MNKLVLCDREADEDMKRARKDSHGAQYEFDAGVGDLSHRIVKKSTSGRPKSANKALLGEPEDDDGSQSRNKDPTLGANGRILCRVCGDNAVRHVHYGGHCCFSCKAFFRRAVNWQNKNDRPFQCKFDRKCLITIKNRKTCQCCRFEKCMATGMNPTWVLSEDQRRKRFKKYRDYGNPEDDEHSSSQSPEQDLMDAKDPASRRRIKSCPSPQSRHRPTTPDYASRASRLSGPMFRGEDDISPEALHVPVIKTEQKDEFEMSPLRDDPFNMDFGDHNKHLEDNGIKMEPDLDSLDNIDSLFNTTDQLETFNPKSKISHFDPNLALFDQSFPYKGHGARDNDGSPEPNKQVAMIEKPLFLKLTEAEEKYILKLEMSYENSNRSFPHMDEETMEIWNHVESSCNFQTLKHGFTSGLLTEAIELCLRRNLIFLEENSDFTSLSLEDRKLLYTKNMGNMCHVRGVMQLKAKYNFACNTGSNCFQISYKQQRTGKIKRWNMVDFPFDQVPNFSDSFDSSDGSNSPKNFPWSANPNLPKTNTNHPSRAKFDLLHMAESLRSLELNTVTYLILLLVVLFCGQGENMNNNDVVDKMQNRYMVLLYRYLQFTHGRKKVSPILSKIMTFVLNMLTDAY